MLTAADIPAYLQPQFDANSLTINELISILLDHNVAVPPVKAKKEVYVGLFDTHVAPRRNQLIAQLSRPVYPLKPTSPPVRTSSNSAGINVESAKKRKPVSSASTPQALGTTPRTPKANVNAYDHVDANFSDDNPFQSGGEESPEKKQQKVKRIKAAAPPGTASGVQFLSDDDGGGVAPRRSITMSSRGRTGNPPQPFMFRTRTPDINFSKTTDSIFGSDRMGDHTTVHRGWSGIADMRKRAGKVLTRRRASRRVWTDDEGPGEEESGDGNGEEGWKSVLPSPATQTFPVNANTNATPRTSRPASSTIRSALKKASPRTKVVAPRRKGAPITMVVRISSVVLLVLLAHWFYSVKDTLQFCEVNDGAADADASQADGTPSKGNGLGDWNPLLKMLPTCISCPSNAVCVGKTVLSCQNSDHSLQANMVSRAMPNLPFPFDIPSCVENKQKVAVEARQAQQVDRGVSHLDHLVRTWIGKAQCNELSAEEARSVPNWAKQNGHVWGMPPAEAKRQLRRSIGHKWSTTRFEEYWDLLLRRINPSSSGHLPSTPVKTEFDKSGRFLALVSSSEPIISFSCRFKTSVFQTIRAYSVHLIVIGVLCVIAAVSYDKSVADARESKTVELLVDDVLDSIAQAAEHHLQDPDRYPLPGISVDQLRDHLLPVPVRSGFGFGNRGRKETTKDADGRTRWHLNDDVARERLWAQVCKVILRNSTVRETSMEVKGEMHTIWQWIGSDLLSPRRSASNTNLQDMSNPILGPFGSPVVPALAKRLAGSGTLSGASTHENGGGVAGPSSINGNEDTAGAGPLSAT
ncbi:hypothetical protein SeLEV6574_g03068 [Synchytrium endobioticum]|uniref:LEM-like domain-containing protein n=1 Tax=Synchytrium endobioticum TaxID=286115 RepID=A0A507D5P3_9FUNG|nr:hypothetical protein SeLEV6574_g03068 [Synchytrium endobioticum]